ncbi:SRPBCC family protein [Mesorhizobium sp. M0047]|uniref:SRPBCC family protein n=1 Tax=Mesorhizobium sp. M0047 TaxID=2956859 RepID=UPI0033391AE3
MYGSPMTLLADWRQGKKMVDITVRSTMAAAADSIATVMFDPSRDPEWIGGVQRVEVIALPPYGIGTRVRRHGAFIGRSFAWVTEVTEFEPGRLVRMKYVSGPFAGGVDYSILPVGEGSEVVIRNYGNANFWFHSWRQ